MREILHVPTNYPKLTQNWSQQISDNYAARVNESFLPVVQWLLDEKIKLKVQVVSGLNDAKDCNFLGTDAWLQRVQGRPASDFQKATPVQWKDAQGNVIGFYQDGGQLSWLKVLNAGHMAAMDQPLLVQHILAALKV